MRSLRKCYKNPHRGRERELMKGGKRLAYFFPSKEEDDELEKFGHEFYRLPFERHGTTRWLVFRLEDRHLADKFIEVHRAYDRGEISLIDAHRRCGELLGYTSEDIESFARRLSPL